MLWKEVSMDKREANELTDKMLITDALIQLKAMQDLLISKGVFTRQEFEKSVEGITKTIAKSILKSANVPGDLDAMIEAIDKNQN
jgi:hypothetical protein